MTTRGHTALTEDNYQTSVLPGCTLLVWIPASLAVCSPPGAKAVYTSPAVPQNPSHTETLISLICLRPPYLHVCLHLLACITSCLSHYLSFCISVCPPASAPLLRPQRDIIFFSRNNDLFAFLPGVHELQDNIISFIILVECFIFPLLHLTPLCFSLFCLFCSQAGRKAG